MSGEPHSGRFPSRKEPPIFLVYELLGIPEQIWVVQKGEDVNVSSICDLEICRLDTALTERRYVRSN